MSRGTAYYDLPNGERIELPTTMPDVEEVPGPLCDGKFELPEAVKETLFELRNMVLNDQGGGRMSVTQGTSGTLRAQEHGHPPITFDKMGGTEKT